MRDAAEIMFS